MSTNESINFDPHVSVDCVILGYDGESLQILLSLQSKEAPNEQYNRLKLPGRLLHTDEDLDDAARAIVSQLTHSQSTFIQQFHAYGSPERTKNPKDVYWLENAIQQKIGRIVTISYLSLIRITNRTPRKFLGQEAVWMPVDKVPNLDLAFDHGLIIKETLQEVYRLSAQQPQLLIDMLPPKFTALQLRRLHEQVSGKEIDARNFSKTVLAKPWIVALDEWEQNVSHRAARLYKFSPSKW